MEHSLLLRTAYASLVNILLGLLLVLFIRRLLLHPLAKYPGPFLARLTNGYGAYQAVRLRTHLAVYRGHIKHGAVFRLGPEKLVFNTATALQDIYHNPRVNKSFVYEVSRPTPLGTVFDVVDINRHQRKRKIISQPLSERSLRNFESTMIEQVDIFIKELQRSSAKSEPVNIFERSTWLGTDVAGHLGFGYSLETQIKETNRPLLQGLTLVAARVNIYMQFPDLMVIEPLVRFLGRELRKKYLAALETMISSRVTLEKDARHDLYSFAADSMTVGASLKDSELWSESFTFMAAGGGTTAVAISALFFYLSRYPKSYQKLQDEIRGAFSSPHEIQGGQKLQGCKYLRACINEALRLSPPTSGMLWREQLPPAKGGGNDPLIIDGHVIPPGTQFAVSIYAIHHNEEYFPDSFTFKPERWLMPDTSVMQTAFAPFGIGSRACAGKAVALLEISLVFAKTLYLFDFQVPTGEFERIGGGFEGRIDGRHRENEYQLYDHFLATGKGPVLEFISRESNGY